jgi:hypothetical protein
MFNENSQIAKTWVNLITNQNDSYTRENVPNLFNLREVVYSMLDATEGMTENEATI